MSLLPRGRMSVFKGTVALLVVLIAVLVGVLYTNEDLRVQLLQGIFKESNLRVVRSQSTPAVHKFDPSKNRQWILKSRPNPAVSKDDFEFRVTERPTITEGQVLFRQKLFSFDPTQKGWMAEQPTYRKPISLGSPMEAMSAAVVVESKNPKFKVGDTYGIVGTWEDYHVFTPGKEWLSPFIIPKGVSPLIIMCFTTDITAIYGMEYIGGVKSGDVVLVSGAAGATGSVAGQVAKLLGASKVVGIAGGQEKTKLLTSLYNFDVAIDYKSENVTARLEEIFGGSNKGVDVYYDNVGGDLLNKVLGYISEGARVVICGSISTYNSEKSNLHESNIHLGNYLHLLVKSAKMEGFIIVRHLFNPRSLLRWVYWQITGSLTRSVDVRQNFDNIPETLIGLFKGTNVGKLVLENDN